jgi:phosphatidylglycerol:prolipoprotein diacylglycerol transferase
MPSPATITIDVDPIILRLGHIAVGWYGLAVILGIGAALLVTRREFQRRGLPEDALWGIVPWAIAGGIIGARVFHVVDNWPTYSSDPLRILALQKGGLAIGGALLGGIAATLLVASLRRVPLLDGADAAAPGIVLGQALGRLGCLVTGDALGSETGLPWGVSYLNPGSMAPASGVAYQPVFAYEALWDLGLFVLLWTVRGRIKRPGGLFAIYLGLYAGGKFAITFLRDEQRWALGLQEAHFVALLLAVVGIAVWVSASAGARRALRPAAL